MKKLLVFVLLLFVLGTNATTYYVSDSGVDTNSGTSILSPWKSLTKVNSVVYVNGDKVLFKRGDTFVGTLTPTKSSTAGAPITYGAYGTGNKPVITSLTTLAEWTQHSGNIYKTTGIPANCDIVTIDGVSVSMGKFPQNGEATYESYTGITSITDNQLTGTPNWTGAEVVIWKSNWTIDRGPITNHTNSTLTYTSGSSYAIQASGGLKYYIQRSLNTLTYQGAWYCDGTNFYMYFSDGTPSNYVVKAGASNYTVYASAKNYNVVRDLEIEGGNLAGIYLTSLSGFSFRSSVLKNTGLIGLQATSSTTTTTVDSCAVSYVNGTAISIISAGSSIKNSAFNQIGQFAGMGGAGGGSHYGIYSKGVGNITERNVLTNIGYIPIYWESSSAICRYNIVSEYPTLKLNDGGGIYTFESVTPQVLKRCYGNVVFNSTANGLYSDGIANNVEFYDNIVANMGKWGIHMNEPIGNSVHDNVFYDCGLAAIDVTNQYFMGSPPASGNTVYNNLVVQAESTEILFSLQDQNTNNSILNFGTSDNNTFVVSPLAASVFYNQKGSATSLPFSALYYTFANWKTLTGKEANSVYRAEDLSTLQFIYNDTFSAKTFEITGAKTDLQGINIYQDEITLQPFNYLVLLPTTLTPSSTKSRMRIGAGYLGIQGKLMEIQN